MSRITLCCLGLLSATAGLWSVPAAAAAPVQYTSRTQFRIPYRFDAAEMQRIGAREIRLFLSQNRGVRWQTAQTVPPRSGRFDFQAPGDGEYWFAVRTVDAQNLLHPPTPVAAPELRVVVDTAVPVLRIRLEAQQPGRVSLAWQASDSHVNLSTLKLEFRNSATERWQRVAISPQREGTTSWSAPAGGTVEARGTVQDLAGNIGRGQASVQVQAAGRARPSVPDFSQPIASTPQPPPASSPQAQITPRGSYISDPGHSRPEIVRPRYSAAGEPLPASATPPSGVAQNASVTSRTFPQDAGIPDSGSLAEPEPVGSTSGGSNASRPPHGRLVKSRRFQIGYTLDDVGPSGVSSVELYITQNNGEKWYLYGIDEDRTTPFGVEVHEDGVYGFSLRVRSGAGLSAAAPQAGERPAIIVVVDQTPPSVQIMPPRQGTGRDHNRVLLSWQVSDQNLIDRPISLSYASSPNGPWEPITGWIRNTGSYDWAIGPGLPQRLFVRITARDAAGNVARAESPHAVVVDLSRPTARIVDIEVESSNVRPPQ